MHNFESSYLAPAEFVDSNHPAVKEFANQVIRNVDGKTAQAQALYYAIRDSIRYDPYKIDLRPHKLRASDLLTRDHGYCIEKANLLAASARAIGIPSRLGFANVRNHIGTEKLEEVLGTNLLVFHGYTELFLVGKWVKATPAFNQELCHRLSVAPLEFDGHNDSIFQEYDSIGGKFMDYVHNYGTFADIPRDLFISELRKHYPHVFEPTAQGEDRYFIVGD